MREVVCVRQFAVILVGCGGYKCGLWTVLVWNARGMQLAPDLADVDDDEVAASCASVVGLLLWQDERQPWCNGGMMFPVHPGFVFLWVVDL